MAIAQTPGNVYRLALVSPGGLVPESAPYAKLLLGGLAKLGYTPGQNLAFEGPRGAAGQPVHLPHLMEEIGDREFFFMRETGALDGTSTAAGE